MPTATDRRDAEREHDRHDAQLKLHVDQIQTFGNAALRAPGLAAAGGIAAALGY